MAKDEKRFLELKKNCLEKVLCIEDDITHKEVVKKLRGKVDCMLIAESPNTYESYIYNVDSENNSRFRNEIAKAILGPEKYSKIDKEIDKIRELLKKGIYVTDLFYEPICEVEVSEVNKHKEHLFNEIETVEPDGVVLMLPKNGFGRNDCKHERLKRYFEEVNGDEPAEFIYTQEKILERWERKLDISSTKAAPFPNLYVPSGSIAGEWEDREIESFSDWVEENKDWLEIEEDE